MVENRYWIYAKRSEEEWSDWCNVGSLETAYKHAENIRRLGFKAKIRDKWDKKTILSDK